MNYINLFNVCKILICILYAITAAVLVGDTLVTFKKNENQLYRRRMLALSFCTLSVFYFSHFVTLFLFPDFFSEENYFDSFLLLSLFTIPVLSYLLRLTLGTIALLPKAHFATFAIWFICLITCRLVWAFVDSHFLNTLIARCFGGLIWAALLYLQGRIIYKMECVFEDHKLVDWGIRLFAFLFLFLGIAALPVLFLHPGSVYWQSFQFMVWTSHGCLSYYILKRDPLKVILPSLIKSPGLLYEGPPVYNDVIDDSFFGDLYEKLLLYFKTEKPYLKSGVNVAEVAYRLSSNKTYLSRLLNDKLSQNFNQFVNAYRIREAQKLVIEKGEIGLTELCKKVGFTSMASFTAAFKLNTGMTPGEWCKKRKRFH